MLVICSTASTQNKPVDTKQVGRELGVRYVLEGDVQRSGNRSASLPADRCRTDAHLWAERFTGDAAICSPCKTRLRTGSHALNTEPGRRSRPPTEHRDARDCSRDAARLKPPSLRAGRRRLRCSSGRWRLSESVAAQAGLASLTARVRSYDRHGGDRYRARRKAWLAPRRIARNSLAHFAKAQVARAQDRHDRPFPNTRP